MKTGIISDTHGTLPEKVLDIFQGVDLILHAGDIGSLHIIKELGSIAPVKAVHGNMDYGKIAKLFPRTEM
ncbi:MAG: YfcE family phosphodiesterase, partial [Thermodesulfatator sp.]